MSACTVWVCRGPPFASVVRCYPPTVWPQAFLRRWVCHAKHQQKPPQLPLSALPSAASRAPPYREPPSLPCTHTGIVCENMHALGENLRKLLLQAKICTPPGGAMVAKICKLCTVTNTVLGSQTHLLRHKRKLTPHTISFCCRLGAATGFTGMEISSPLLSCQTQVPPRPRLGKSTSSASTVRRRSAGDQPRLAQMWQKQSPAQDMTAAASYDRSAFLVRGNMQHESHRLLAFEQPCRLRPL